MKKVTLKLMVTILGFTGFAAHACELGQICTPDVHRSGFVNLKEPYQGIYYCMYSSADKRESLVSVGLGGSEERYQFGLRPVELVNGEYKKIVVAKKDNSFHIGNLIESLHLSFYTPGTKYGYLPLDAKFTCYKASD